MSTEKESAAFVEEFPTFTTPANPAGARFSSAHFDIQNPTSEADLARFRSDLEAMLQSLPGGEIISSESLAPSPRRRQGAHIERATRSLDARSTLEADVADAVRKLSMQSLFA